MRKIWIFCLLSCLCFSHHTWAECGVGNPHVYVKTNRGVVKYITHLDRSSFIEKYPGTSKNTLGLTVAALGVKITGKPKLTQNSHKACVSIGEVVFTIGYDEILVYIDKKYKPGMCAYRVIKEHENYHVEVHRQALEFFKSDIKKALMKSVKKLKPQLVTSSAQAQQVISEQFAQIQRDIKPVLDHVNKKIKEKNNAIDTPESYQRTHKLCKKW